MVEIDWKSSEPIVLTVSHEHVWDEGTVTKPATCGEKGEKTYTCTVEGRDEKKSSKSLPLVSTPATTVPLSPHPTCGEPGVKKFTCKVCGADLGTEPINPTGEHTWGNWEETLASTCSAKGRKTCTCTVCSATETEDVPMVDHAWDDGKVTTQADKDQPGVKTFTCTECGATKTESIPALGDHVWDEGTVTREPTCAEEGVRTPYLHDLRRNEGRKYREDDEPCVERRRDHEVHPTASMRGRRPIPAPSAARPVSRLWPPPASTPGTRARTKAARCRGGRKDIHLQNLRRDQG